MYPLLVATERNNLPIVNQCIKYQADLNVANNNGKTALILAAERGNVEIVRALLQKDLEEPASLEAQDVSCSLLVLVLCYNV